MKSLRNRSKSFYRKIICHAIIISIFIAASIYSISENIKELERKDNMYEKYKQEQDSLMKDFQQKLDSMQELNCYLGELQEQLSVEFDSVNNIKQSVNEDYEKNIIVIPDASMADHYQWFQSKFSEIRQH
jgi:uncharacterized protein YoxC